MLLVTLSAIAVQAAAPVPPPLSPFAKKKAESLLHDKLPCLGCHELGGDGGRIGPSLTDVGARRDRAYIARMIADPQGTVPGTVMPRVLMPAETRALVVEYLSGVQGHEPAAASRSLPTAPTPGSRLAAPDLYAKFCSSCHGPSGNGDGPNARYLPVPPARHNDAAWMAARADDVLYDAIAGGGAVMGKSPRMPPFGATLSPAELRALVGYLRTLCACQGPGWSRDGP